MTCHIDNMKGKDSEYNDTPYNYPKYPAGK